MYSSTKKKKKKKNKQKKKKKKKKKDHCKHKNTGLHIDNFLRSFVLTVAFDRSEKVLEK